MQPAAARNSDHDTLAWLAFSLRWAEANHKPKLTRILGFVREEVLFEMELADKEAAESLKRVETG